MSDQRAERCPDDEAHVLRCIRCELPATGYGAQPAIGEVGARLRALVAIWRERILESEREVVKEVYSQAGCDAQRGRRVALAECAAELDALLSAPVVPVAPLHARHPYDEPGTEYFPETCGHYNLQAMCRECALIAVRRLLSAPVGSPPPEEKENGI